MLSVTLACYFPAAHVAISRGRCYVWRVVCCIENAARRNLAYLHTGSYSSAGPTSPLHSAGSNHCLDRHIVLVLVCTPQVGVLDASWGHIPLCDPAYNGKQEGRHGTQGSSQAAVIGITTGDPNAVSASIINIPCSSDDSCCQVPKQK